MLDAVRDIRIEDPGIGCYKLWIMLTVLFGADVYKRQPNTSARRTSRPMDFMDTIWTGKVWIA